jgi:hypothetical protein
LRFVLRVERTGPIGVGVTVAASRRNIKIHKDFPKICQRLKLNKLNLS